MIPRHLKKRRNKKVKSKAIYREKIQGFLVLGGLVVVAFGLVYWLFIPGMFSSKDISAIPEENQVLDHSLICMVSSSFRGKQQLPVIINGKTYYAYCQTCVWKLNHVSELRYATDPLTGEKIDKASAIFTCDSERFPYEIGRAHV